ncbi:hypothetical protein FAZ97_23585 [Paraburkholderia acidiphila]|uniref:Uncharacterized protein n=2 Tax=Paraburkholderia acidiphila TaxID=2571747 RepID=A0A7Z2JAW3_9BURK|nr:hypothetical protein FAZ97_23585 [Paraburkholderia acidiphila]
MEKLVFAVMMSMSACAFAQQVALPGIGFRIGDDLAEVKAALHTSDVPEPLAQPLLLPANMHNPNQDKTVLHLRTKGISALFDASNKVQAIRLDAPFAGEVKGVKLGDSAKTVTSKLGDPVSKPATLLTFQIYRYVLDDEAYVAYWINVDGVQAIVVGK